uniref:Secreted protein n=1 Tax=Caenorhabditis japonica TaxID=281687 RepID=A0A8R1IPI5_CAEJA
MLLLCCALYQRLGSVCGSEVLSRIGFLSTLLLYLVDRAAASIAVTLRSSRNSTNVLASAMDRSHRVSMKNAACCVTYHELQTLRVVNFRTHSTDWVSSRYVWFRVVYLTAIFHPCVLDGLSSDIEHHRHRRQ